MRIVAGSLRGRTIDAPAGEGTRPTTDRVREALFSSLYSLRGGFDGAIVLDAFAGSGALGLEAISRGANRAVFFERNAKAADVLKRNIAACGLDATRTQVAKRDIMQAAPLGQSPAFDLVFLDPPYSDPADEVMGMVSSLASSGALADGAIIVYEHALKSAQDVSEAASQAGFDLHASKKYGKTGVSIFIANLRADGDLIAPTEETG